MSRESLIAGSKEVRIVASTSACVGSITFVSRAQIARSGASKQATPPAQNNVREIDAVLGYLHPLADSTRRTLDSPCACSTTHAPIVGSTPSNTPSQQMESRSRLLPYVLPASVVSRRQTSVVRSVFLRTDVATPLERAMAGLHEQSRTVASAAARGT